MDEIDDLYAQEAEDIDANFLEDLKSSKNHEKSIADYRKNLEKTRLKFEKSYGKFNAGEKKRTRKMKKRLEGMPKFEHLEIEHFDFEFGFWERLWFRGDIFIFNIVRKFRRFFAWLFPSWLIYDWCVARNFFRSTWRDFAEYVSGIWRGVKRRVVGFGVFVFGNVKDLWNWVKMLGGKILFWRKDAGKPVSDKDGKEIVAKTENSEGKSETGV
jgi:hypothetical protein